MRGGVNSMICNSNKLFLRLTFQEITRLIHFIPYCFDFTVTLSKRKWRNQLCWHRWVRFEIFGWLCKMTVKYDLDTAFHKIFCQLHYSLMYTILTAAINAKSHLLCEGCGKKPVFLRWAKKCFENRLRNLRKYFLGNPNCAYLGRS